MEVSTPFDAALQALLRAWKVRDDLRRDGDRDHAAIRAAFVELDRAREWMRRVTVDPTWRFERRPDRRTWLPPATSRRVEEVRQNLHGLRADAVAGQIEALIARSDAIHRTECVNLNPATNTMNPAAEAAMARRLGSRPSLGHPGEKYEMGLEAIEEIEVLTAALVADVFGATYVEHRVPSGSIANLYAFMATTRPGDAIIVPPPEVGGHVTHQDPGAAGLYGLQIHHAPVDADRYTVDVDGLASMAAQVRPRLITIGGSMNLSPHPVAAIRAVADDVGARVLFDAAHLCGPIAGGAWPNPLAEGAHLVTMSTYKSLGGPPGGLVLTDDPALAERVEEIAHPGLTANFDAGKTAALAITMLDWVEHGRAYAQAMVEAAATLGRGLVELGLPLVTSSAGNTSHQLALDATALGGGTAAARHLRQANLLASAIGLPRPAVDGDAPGLRLGTPELVRWGITGDALLQLASFIDQAWRAPDPSRLAPKVSRFRREFRTLHHIRHA